MTRRHDHPDHYAPVETLRFSGAFADAVRLIMRKAWCNFTSQRKEFTPMSRHLVNIRLDAANTEIYQRRYSEHRRNKFKYYEVYFSRNSPEYKIYHNRAIRGILRTRHPFTPL